MTIKNCCCKCNECKQIQRCLYLMLSDHRPEADPNQTNGAQEPHSSASAVNCRDSYYGCCPDGITSADGPQGQGCPVDRAPTQPSCMETRYPSPLPLQRSEVRLSLGRTTAQTTKLPATDQSQAALVLELFLSHNLFYFQPKPSVQIVVLNCFLSTTVTAAAKME